MRCAICLELTSCVSHRNRLTVCIQIYSLKHSYFVGRLTSTHNRLSPELLKLRRSGALQICLLLLLIKQLVNTLTQQGQR